MLKAELFIDENHMLQELQRLIKEAFMCGSDDILKKQEKVWQEVFEENERQNLILRQAIDNIKRIQQNINLGPTSLVDQLIRSPKKQKLNSAHTSVRNERVLNVIGVTNGQFITNNQTVLTPSNERMDNHITANCHFAGPIHSELICCCIVRF